MISNYYSFFRKKKDAGNEVKNDGDAKIVVVFAIRKINSLVLGIFHDLKQPFSYLHL